MKQMKFLLYITALAIYMVSCTQEAITYSGPEYIMFSDTATTCPVQIGDEYFGIAIASTVARDYDRTFSVEVIDNGSNAVEGIHYNLQSNTVTIKAGETAADFLVKGNYEQISHDEPLDFTLELVTPENVKWDLYATHEKTKVTLQKVCPFSIDNYTGYCIVSSMFSVNFLGYYQRLIKTEEHPTEPNTIILRDFIRDGYHLNLTFDTEEFLTAEVTVNNDQVIANEVSTIFGGLPGTGDDKLRVGMGMSNASSFQSCDNTARLYMEYYINTLSGIKMVTAGEHLHTLKWISDEEAEIIINQGGLI